MKFKEIFEHTSHRPYPLSSKPWVMKQDWVDLLFMHWVVPVEEIRRLIPKNLDLDLWEGKAYLGIVPFQMRHVRPRFFPSIPYLSFFPELNVRTYVRYKGKPGVFFFSLDAGNSLAVEIARAFFYLPYFRAHFHIQKSDSEIQYKSIRKDPRGNPAILDLSYKPTSPVYLAQKNTLEHWLTERYCLYSHDSQENIFIGEIHHVPWPLQKAEAKIRTNEMGGCHGIGLPPEEPILHFIEKLEVAIYRLEKAS
jgi:uncharacterized protein YqjF (DUF2071 family)